VATPTVEVGFPPSFEEINDIVSELESNAVARYVSVRNGNPYRLNTERALRGFQVSLAGNVGSVVDVVQKRNKSVNAFLKN